MTISKRLMNRHGQVELAWQTHQQDLVVLSSEFHLISPEYTWWSYLSKEELPLFRRDVMFKPCPLPEKRGMKMIDAVKYVQMPKAADGIYTPEIVSRTKQQGKLVVYFLPLSSSHDSVPIQIFVGAGVKTTGEKMAIITEILHRNGLPSITKIRKLYGGADFHESILR